jgi:hypothetical protein
LAGFITVFGSSTCEPGTYGLTGGTANRAAGRVNA